MEETKTIKISEDAHTHLKTFASSNKWNIYDCANEAVYKWLEQRGYKIPKQSKKKA